METEQNIKKGSLLILNWHLPAICLLIGLDQTFGIQRLSHLDDN